jgi:hypothetical protein
MMRPAFAKASAFAEATVDKTVGNLRVACQRQLAPMLASASEGWRLPFDSLRSLKAFDMPGLP